VTPEDRRPLGGDRYEIVLGQRLGARSAARFDDLELVAIPGDGMLLRGTFADQAALHGVLARIRDLGVPLLAVRRIDPPGDEPDPGHPPG
jgi:hypothetical protein